MKYALIVLDDQDQHGAGCECGLCNSNGKSYGASAYDVTDLLHPSSYEDEIEYFLEDTFPDLDPFDKMYAPSETTAYRTAVVAAEQQGYRIVNKNYTADSDFGTLEGNF